MKLYFLRHADAVKGADDRLRPLSPKGERQARDMGQFLSRAGIEFEAAYTSPFVRAKQTMELLLQAMASAMEGEETPALTNAATQQGFETWLHGLPNRKKVLLVGHSPSLPERVRQLLGVQSIDAVEIPKGGVVCVKTDDGLRGELKFFLTPKLIRGSE
jgi:phosphohistidine phosphatase